MKLPDLPQFTKNRPMGALLIVIGLIVVLMPVFVGEWVIGLLGMAFIAAGLVAFVATFRSKEHNSILSYLTGVIFIFLGFILFLSPHTVLSGVLAALTLFFLIDGGIKLFRAFKLKGADRGWSMFNGLATIALAFIVWYLVTARLGLVSIGLVLGLRLIAEGWTMVLKKEQYVTAEDEIDTRYHPDRSLRLEPSVAIKTMQDDLLRNEAAENSANIALCLKFLLLFFAIHLLRTSAQWSFIGFISPFTAVIGDAIMALILGIGFLLPLRLLFRKLTRPLERTAWKRFNALAVRSEDPTFAERGLRYWLAIRMKLALDMQQSRYSLHYAGWRLLRIGLPLTAIFIAVNSIWGFSWYFNSENWASGVWQEITKARVDAWRKRGAEDAERDALAKGIAQDKVFAVEPEGVTDGDFSFVVIGDTGEGDPSQMSLRKQLIDASKRDSVKFLVLSSDVIYPDGKMKDYETNFYLPFMGFEKPIYAIPGNHDWFDADEGFNANFLEHDAAMLSLKARFAADLKTNMFTIDQRYNEMTAEAKRLREYYGIKNGVQRAPYFEMHSNGFSLICVDTGILRTVDEKEKSWLLSALQRAGNNFKFVVLGHPFYVAGRDTAEGDAGFSEIREILRSYKVDVVMAGDTHDFEYYKEKLVVDGKEKEVQHFVNGGGGAYLSIGTSAAFPTDPFTPDYAYYPRTDELQKKIYKETPYWKLPFYWWMQYLGGWPFDSEMVSGAFDFNRAPFFQSFIEVRVERSQNRVRSLLYGVNGQLRWRDIQVSNSVMPSDKTADDFVEFIAPLRPTP